MIPRVPKSLLTQTCANLFIMWMSEEHRLDWENVYPVSSQVYYHAEGSGLSIKVQVSWDQSVNLGPTGIT